MTTLAQLTKTLGPSLLRVAAAPQGLDASIHDVVVYDAEPLEINPGDLVLAVGVPDEEGLAGLVDHLAGCGASGLVAKVGALSDGRVVRSAESSGLALIALPQEASWYQVVLLVHSVLTHSSDRDDGTSQESTEGLFALADAVATLVDAPVTIEDRWSRVLAYSVGQEQADEARAQTLVGRRVPARILERLEELGVFERLRREVEPFYVESIGEGVLPRLVTPIRTRQEFLGSMWAAIETFPSNAQRQEFADAAKVAALHLLRHRVEADAERHVQTQLVASVLDGKSEAVQRLGIAGGGFRILAMHGSGEETEDKENLARLQDILMMHLSANRIRAAVGLLGRVVYCIMPTDKDRAASHDRCLTFAQNFVTQVRSVDEAGPIVGIGGHAGSTREVPRSRREADDVLRVMHDRGSTPPVQVIEDVRAAVFLRRFADTVGPDDKQIYEAEFGQLLDSDERHGTSYIETLRAYFDSFGDFPAAARRLHIHPNTLRYRLRRAQQISGIDLDDAEERLGLMLLVSVLLKREVCQDANRTVS